jgi:hypothetical protein
VETLFGSSPDDFKDFGVYTVRLYKNGQWVEVSNTCTHTHTHSMKMISNLPQLRQAHMFIFIGVLIQIPFFLVFSFCQFRI